MEKRIVEVKRGLSVAKMDGIRFMDNIVGLQIVAQCLEIKTIERELYGRKDTTDNTSFKDIEFGVIFDKPIDEKKVYEGRLVVDTLEKTFDACLTVIGKELFNMTNRKMFLEQLGVEIGYMRLHNRLLVKRGEMSVKEALENASLIHEDDNGVVLYKENEILDFILLKDFERNLLGEIEFIIDKILRKIEF